MADIFLRIFLWGRDMKGVIFTEFIELVEGQFSEELAEQLIERADLPSGGSYTSLGTYDHAEILSLVTHLSQITGADAGDLQLAFGEFLFGRFAEMHGNFMAGVPGALDFLAKVDNYIHIEVEKLYPEATPPRLDYNRLNERQMELHYRSHRPFALVAHGLIVGCGKHFGENLQVRREDLPGTGPGTEAKFILEVQDQD